MLDINKSLPYVDHFYHDSICLEGLFEAKFHRGANSNYENVVEFSKEAILDSPELSLLLDYVRAKYNLLEKGYMFNKLWLVETLAQDVNTSNLPYIPHIDYRRFLKVMIYVNDVSESCGPFSAVRCDPEDFESLRLSLKPNYKDYQGNRIDNFDLSEFEKYSGKEGTEIVFDTNCPHFAGAVCHSSRRRVFRFDFELPSWSRKTSLLTKIRNKIGV